MRSTLAALLLAVALSAPPAAAATFDDFKGVPGLQAIMEDFLVKLLEDPRTRPFFEKSNQTRLKAQLVDQFCELLEGPCVYRGARMDLIHQGEPIHMEHFNALVEALQDAMDIHGVPFRAQNRLLAKLAPMYRVIVQQ